MEIAPQRPFQLSAQLRLVGGEARAADHLNRCT
jgi:hypothetical protein